MQATDKALSDAKAAYERALQEASETISGEGRMLNTFISYKCDVLLNHIECMV